MVAGEPYETIGFKIPSRPIDFEAGKFLEQWDADTRKYRLQMCFKEEVVEGDEK